MLTLQGGVNLKETILTVQGDVNLEEVKLTAGGVNLELVPTVCGCGGVHLKQIILTVQGGVNLEEIILTGDLKETMITICATFGRILL